VFSNTSVLPHQRGQLRPVEMTRDKACNDGGEKRVTLQKARQWVNEKWKQEEQTWMETTEDKCKYSTEEKLFINEQLITPASVYGKADDKSHDVGEKGFDMEYFMYRTSSSAVCGEAQDGCELRPPVEN